MFRSLGLQSTVIRHPSSVIGLQSSVHSHQSSVIRHRSSVIGLKSSVIRRHPSSVIGLQSSHPSSVIRHRSSVIRHRSSVIRRRSSVIRHRSSVIRQYKPQPIMSHWACRSAKQQTTNNKQLNKKHVLCKKYHIELSNSRKYIQILWRIATLQRFVLQHP